jgi:alpha-phosphoglucomutase
MYEKYGYYKDNVIAITHKGIEGLQKIQSIMDNLRKNPPMKFGNYDVTAVRDYLKDEIVNVKTGEKKPTGIPKSNVLYFELTEDAWLCVRPSGTEPKIKLYFGVVGKDLADADEKSEKLAVIVKDLLNQLG